MPIILPANYPRYPVWQYGRHYRGYRQLLTNGDIETALSGTVNAFVDPLADGLAWTPNLPAPVANISTLVAGTTYVAGHAEWWDVSSGTQFRWEWQTGGTMYRYIRYVDANNWVRIWADGANFKIQKNIAGGGATDVGTPQAAVLANATFYWFTWTISGTSFTASLMNDNAGAVGTQVATTGAQTISDAAVVVGTKAVGCLTVNLRIGGGTTPCRVVIPAPLGWSIVPSAGVPAFCVSKTNKFSGTHSASVFGNGTVTALWAQPVTNANTTHTLSGRMKYSNIVGTRASLQTGLTEITIAKTGTSDWTAVSGSAVIGANSTIDMGLVAASGTAWFDNLWLAQQAYDTGNIAHQIVGALTR